MRITKRQLRRIIKEERLSLFGWDSRHPDLMTLLDQAASAAALNDPWDADAVGNESKVIAAALQKIWIAAGFDTKEIFK
jgi:hypothetical protein